MSDVFARMPIERKVLFYVLAFLVLILPALLLEGFVVQYLWRLYMAPVFGLPELLLWQAIGLGLVTGILTIRVDTVKQELDAKKVFYALFGRSLMYLVFGWTLSFWI
jgi:hypothetical protein